MGTARARTSRIGNRHGSRLGYLPSQATSQYHVDCSGLIPEHEGMPPLYQRQPKAVTITWRFLKHHLHSNEYSVDNINYNEKFQKYSFYDTYTRKIRLLTKFSLLSVLPLPLSPSHHSFLTEGSLYRIL